MSAATVPAKIVMRGTSQQSLNDRFTQIATQPTVYQPRCVGVSNGLSVHAGYEEYDVKPIVSPRVDRVTAINRRLAKEMENRPSVQAALAIGIPRQHQSVLQRLGAKSRLGFKSKPFGFKSNALGFGYSRGGFRGRGGGRRLGFMRSYSYNKNNRFQSFPYRPSSWGIRKEEQTRWAEAVLSGDGIYRPQTRFTPSGRGRRGAVSFRYQRGGRGFRRGGRFGGGRGFGRGGFGKKLQMSRDELDKQLDDYMVKTKSHLDADMDSYMVEAAA